VGRAINNVIIEGVGKGTYFAYDGTSAIFSAGSQSNWVFRDFRTDAGGITVTGATSWIEDNVIIGTTHYILRTSDGEVIIGLAERENLAAYILPELLYDTSISATYGVLLDRFATVDGWTQSISGSGTTTHNGILSLQLATGATSGSYASRYTARAFAVYDQAADLIIMWATQASVTNSTFWLAMTVDPTPGDNVQGFGWKVVNGTLYAWNSDGTNNNLTDTGVTLAAQTPYTFWIEHKKGAANIKYYVGGVLKATHTTYLPNSWYHILYYITNSAAEDKQINLKRTDFIGGGVGG